jgi:hypothetical protein
MEYGDEAEQKAMSGECADRTGDAQYEEALGCRTLACGDYEDGSRGHLLTGCVIKRQI